MQSTFGERDDVLCRIVCDACRARTALDYVSDLFVDSWSSVGRVQLGLGELFQVDAVSSPVTDIPECVQFLSLDSLKEAVLSTAESKHEELKQMKISAEKDIDSVRALEKQVADCVKLKVTDVRQCEKLTLCLRDLDQVTHLLLMLAGRLARHDITASACRCNSLAPSADQQTHQMLSRRTGVVDKLSDARLLKVDIDRRCESLGRHLTAFLPDVEQADYRRLLADKTRVLLQQREVDDWMRLTDDVLRTLRDDVNASSHKADLSASMC
jgi:hypothetical protein